MRAALCPPALSRAGSDTAGATTVPSIQAKEIMMVRRFLCLGAILLLLLTAPACGDSKKNTGSTVRDPDGDYVPKPGGPKAG